MKTMAIYGYRSNQRGALLISLIAAMTILASLGTVVLHFTSSSTEQQLMTNVHSRALYLAESGGRYAYPLVKSDVENSQTTNIDQLHNQTFTLGSDGQFLIEVDTSSDPNNVFVHSTGIANSGTALASRVKITYRMARTNNNPFKYGSFGVNQIKLKDDSRITGDVGTNGGASKIKIQDDSVVTGNQDDSLGMTLTTPSCSSGNYSDLEIEDETITLTAGNYNYEEVKIEDGGILRISGDVTMLADRDFKMEDNAQIVILANSSLTIYADDEVEIKDDAEINKNGAAQNFVLYMCHDDDLKIKDDAVVNGGFFAPLSNDVKIDDDAHVTGSVVGKKVKLEDDAQITYDATMLNVQPPGSSSSVSDPVQYFPS